MKFLRFLWFSAACFVVFICFVAGIGRDEDTRSTFFTAYPGNLYKNINYFFRTFTEKFICFKAITRKTSNFATLFESDQRRLISFSTLRRLHQVHNPEDWSAMLKLEAIIF